MENKSQIKYRRIEERISDIAACAGKELILVGGTALALFYLRHRASVDLDFVPIMFKNEEEYTRQFKGELSKLGYRAARSAFTNQFVINFENTAIKIEIFVPDGFKPKNPAEIDVQGNLLLVATLDDLTAMKIETYASRKQGRDLYDLFCIPEKHGGGTETVKNLVRKCGKPENLDYLQEMVFDQDMFKKFMKVIADAS